MQDKISNALVAHPEARSVNPFMVLNELEAGLKHHSLITSDDLRTRYRDLLVVVKEEYENIVKNEVQRAIAADEDALKRLCANYIDNVKAYTQREKVKNKYTGQYEEPDERLMRSIEEKIDIPDSRKDDFRREIMNYIGALVDRRQDVRLQDQRTALQGAGAEVVRRSEGHDQADEPGVERGRCRNAGQDRRGQVTADSELRLRRRECDGRVELRGQHFRARRRQGQLIQNSSARAVNTAVGTGTGRRSGETRMTTRIRRDVTRFREIVRGKIRDNMRKYVTHGEMIGRKGKDLVSIPVPQLDVPHFRYGNNKSGGVGQGDGRAWTADWSRARTRRAKGAAGNQPGATSWKSRSRWTNWPICWATNCNCRGSNPRAARISPKRRRVTTASAARARIRCGTSNAAMSRPCGGRFPPAPTICRNPRVVPIREDMRYRSWTTVNEPQANAVTIYMMDVSGSMTDQQKKIVRTEAFWIDTWLRRQYNGLERRYIIHDAAAKEVDEETFYHTRESGGTRISSAYKVCQELIEREFPVSDWNIYCFQFSDGDNWGEDNKESLRMLADDMLPVCNLFCYGQVESPYGSGDYIQSLRARFGDQPRIPDPVGN